MTGIESETPRRTDRKSTLVCPICDRKGSTDGGWSLVDHDGRTDVACPECGKVIVSQPQFDDDGRLRPIPA